MDEELDVFLFKLRELGKNVDELCAQADNIEKRLKNKFNDYYVNEFKFNLYAMQKTAHKASLSLILSMLINEVKTVEEKLIIKEETENED